MVFNRLGVAAVVVLSFLLIGRLWSQEAVDAERSLKPQQLREILQAFKKIRAKVSLKDVVIFDCKSSAVYAKQRRKAIRQPPVTNNRIEHHELALNRTKRRKTL